MNETEAILRAAGAARAAGRPLLLATVARVRGSAYRRPGARMLLGEDGWLAGGVSGGCLEADIQRKAWWRTADGPVVVEYDSTLADADEDAFDLVDEDDGGLAETQAWGFGLGCNGVVEVLLERVAADGDPASPLGFLERCLRARERGVLATVIAADARAAAGDVAVGQRLAWRQDAAAPDACTLGSAELAGRVLADARRALAGGGRTANVSYRLADGGARADLLLEVVLPPVPLLICGAGHDVAPLVRLAKAVGWHVTVADPRPGVAAAPRPDRFPGADAVVAAPAGEIAARVAVDDRTMAVLMTHNVLLDAALLRALLPSPVRYLGVLGPKRRTERLLASLPAALRERRPERLHYPAGLDVGAETPEAIALSVLAEMQAVAAGRSGGFLKDRDLPIHDPAPAQETERRVPAFLQEPALCELAAPAR